MSKAEIRLIDTVFTLYEEKFDNHDHQPASKDAGFHYVQARLLLTRHRP